MKFLTFMQSLETQLGYLYVPLNSDAGHLNELFETSPLHHDFMVQFAKFVYKQNRCTHLKAEIDKSNTQKALTPLRLKALKSTNTDIDIYSFIDNLCFVIDAVFSEEDKDNNVTAAATDTRDNAKSADIIDLGLVRQRRLNSRA